MTEVLSHVEVADRITISINELEAKRAALQIHLDSLVSTGSGQSAVPSPPSPSPVQSDPPRPYEIREFCDEEGRLLDAQVVDMSSELLSAGQAVRNDKTGGGDDVLRGKDGKVVSTEEVLQRLKEALNIPDVASGEELPEEVNVSTTLCCGSGRDMVSLTYDEMHIRVAIPYYLYYIVLNPLVVLALLSVW
jgi:hypothetical protein